MEAIEKKSTLSGGELQSVFILFIVFLTTYLVWNNRKKKWDKMPPGPPSLPIVGSLPWLGTDMREPLRKMGKKYGDVLTIQVGSRAMVILNSCDAIKEAFVKHGYAFSGRPQDTFFYHELGQGFGIGATHGDFWKEQRRFTHTVLRDFGMGKPLIEQKILEELTYFSDKIKEQSAKGPFFPNHTIRMAVTNIIGNVFWGCRGDYEDPVYKEFIEIIVTVVEDFGSEGLFTAFPFLRSLPFDLFNCNRLRKNANFIKKKLMDHIKEHRQSWEGQPRDFIDAYLNKLEGERDKDDTTFTERQLQQILSDLLFAGVETTGSTVLWAIIYMLNFPDVLKKVEEEIDRVIGRERMPSMKDKQDMPYTEATILEIQRVADVIPFAIPHVMLEDVEMRGYSIPKGTTVLPNIYAAHRDERVWDEPDKFKPERFLDDHGKYLKKEQLILFGVGKRVCLGEGLARMEVFLFVTYLFQRFRFVLPPGEKVPSIYGVAALGHACHPFNILVKDRN